LFIPTVDKKLNKQNLVFVFVGGQKSERTTWGFVQAGLDVETSAVCIAVLWFGMDGILLSF
jgi:hypothetical protein